MTEHTTKLIQNAEQHHVVIVGGGFGGLYCARSLRHTPVRITLIDRRNFHLFQPLLYQVATGGLSPANIAAPLRGILARQRNVTVLLAEATGFDPAHKRVLLRDGELTYDSLVVATGVTNNYFGNDDWEVLAPGLKTIEDATRIRAQVLHAFEAAERETDPERIRRWLTFVVIGAGPTGVELAGALAEIARDTLRHNFRRINPAGARVLLLDLVDRALPAYPADLSEKATACLNRLGVQVHTGVRVTNIAPTGVTIERDGVKEQIPTRTVLWAAGTMAPPLAQQLAEQTGAAQDRLGRLIVNRDCTLPDHPSIFVLGDLGHFKGPDSQPLPGIAPVAMQQGSYVARAINSRLAGKAPPPFTYHHRGSMATIGRAAAVADLGWVRLSGRLAWLAWLFVHIIFLIEFQNRLLVLLQWAWNYVTFNRSARLITNNPPPSQS